ncbi:3'-5' exonuclease [Marinobacter sp. CHS3-4]|uniref:3'-5' exonuclease n=1 Tax=Marinobacter sp. CHS3-4 TaxID=3045174 RepID=UPI0024B5B905|nr:3'-5' exonuclease [Marinobacter sp. CHS3-4]MDI9246808.1 3'-5' exonuclease [Marinobacter sp. CHS3-4]
MINSLKQLIGRIGSKGAKHPRLEDLPPPVVPGEQSLTDCRLIVLDLETTGLNQSKDEVIAIGAVAIQDNAVDLSDQFDLVLRRPELDISETVLIHGIGPEALTRGHETEDALLHLLEWMNGDPVLAYHSAFDQSFLERTLRRKLAYTKSHTWFDVADLMPAFFPDSKPSGHGLDDWADHFGLEVSARHHAAADALATAELTLVAINQAQKKGISTLKALSERLKYYRRLRDVHRH